MIQFNVSIFAWPCVLSVAVPRSGGYHLEMGGMSLQDTVGVNRKNGATTETHGAGAWYMG